MTKIVRKLYKFTKSSRFTESGGYWQRRYALGGHSGSGSHGRLAHFKASFLNDLVRAEGVTQVVEFGCGDGSQLLLSEYPRYVGVDVSTAAVDLCQLRFANDKSKAFVTLDAFRRNPVTADLCLSLDVIYHLIEDEVFEAHMIDLFNTSTRLVTIYSSNSADTLDPAPHVRHRNFSAWIEREVPEWKPHKFQRNPYPFRWWNRNNTSRSDMHVFRKIGAATV